MDSPVIEVRNLEAVNVDMVIGYWFRFIGVEMNPVLALENKMRDAGVDPNEVEPFATLDMPCGQHYEFSRETFPKVTTPCLCGNPQHFAVVIDEA